jgi:ribosomal protein L29
MTTEDTENTEREQKAKLLRDMIQSAIGNAEELTMYGRDLCRELRQLSVVLRAELDQLKEGGK